MSFSHLSSYIDSEDSLDPCLDRLHDQLCLFEDSTIFDEKIRQFVKEDINL